MFPARLQNRRNLVPWLALITAVAVPLAMLATGLFGAERGGRQPRLLPDDMGQVARPMDTEAAEKPESPRPLAGDMGRQVWDVLIAQQAGDFEMALDGWMRVELPPETDVWRWVAVASAHLERGALGDAEKALTRAAELAPENALMHYFTALLRMEQARGAYEWNDAVGPSRTRLAAYRPLPVVPNSRSMFYRTAAMELHAAIDTAGYVAAGQPLVPAEWSMDWIGSPTVGDLLAAIGAENFEANAHNMLGSYYFDRSMLEQAEEHMDQATRMGVDVLFGYRDLGERYEQDGRHLDAARAYAKAMQRGSDFGVPTKRMLENLRRGLIHGR